MRAGRNTGPLFYLKNSASFIELNCQSLRISSMEVKIGNNWYRAWPEKGGGGSDGYLLFGSAYSWYNKSSITGVRCFGDYINKL